MMVEKRRYKYLTFPETSFTLLDLPDPIQQSS